MGRRPGEAPTSGARASVIACTCRAPAGPQRAGAFVERGAGRVDVVDERHRPRAGTRGERAAHVAPAPGRIEPALRADVARASQQARDGKIPAAPELGGELGRRVGPAQQAAVAYGGDDGERFRRRARKLVDDQDRRRAARARSRRASSARRARRSGPSSQNAERAVASQRSREQARHAVDRERGRRPATRAERRGERAQARAAAVAQPVARTPAG